WHAGNSNVSSQPVGGKTPNELGLFDMTGNIYEWCWDWYDSDYYEFSPVDNPTGVMSSTVRSIRGGSWNTTADGSRLANRLNFLPGARRTTFAFRVARSK
ncbi:MAG: SUMF1/EgtB/PvdO family nonheme iron enzyme, partial [Mameliella sp.]|nr:SUMF1/EgtB/PvdO family nonheme iron enzyme [Phaeodactylibacter sp.]